MTQTTAQRLFALGVNSLDRKDEAARNFEHAVNSDPLMCDAWIGLMATSPAHANSPDVARGVLKSIRNFGNEIGANGITIDSSQGALGLKVPLTAGVAGLGLTMPIPSATYARCAAVLTLAEGGHLAEAAQELERLRSDASLYPGARNFATFIWVSLLGQARRWPEILSAETDSREPLWHTPDVGLEFWQKGMLALKVRALVGTGDHASALATTDQALASDDFALIRPSLTVTKAYALRALGDEEQADKVLTDARAWMKPRPDLDHAASGGTLDLVTVESLATRADPWDPTSGTAANQIARELRESAREAALEEAWKELDALIGVPFLKQQIHRIARSIEANKVRKELALELGEEYDEDEMRLSAVVTGPPGTGKTTGVRILAKLFYGLGVIARPDVYEKKPSDLITGYVGQAGIRTNKLIDESKGGLFFLDEAYGLVAGSGDDTSSRFGMEALDVMLARIENEGNAPLDEKIVVIIAGYSDDMRRLLAVNEGLPLRFPTKIDLHSNTPEELREIAVSIAAGKRETLSESAIEYLRDHNKMLPEVSSIDEHGRTRSGVDRVSNARFMRQVVDTSRRFRDQRVMAVDRTGMSTQEKQVLFRTLEVVDVQLAYEEVIAGTPFFPHNEFWQAVGSEMGIE